jgi:putative transcriptional regulator
MGREKMKIADVSRLAGLNRSTVTALYQETAKRIELDAVDQLCRLFKCEASDLLEYVPDDRQE